MKLQIKRNNVVASEITITAVSRYLDEHEIKYIRTQPEYRGKGYASALIERAKLRCNSLVAFLDPDATGLTVEQMEAWYKRHGFKKIRYDFGSYNCIGRWNENVLKAMYWEAVN